MNIEEQKRRYQVTLTIESSHFKDVDAFKKWFETMPKFYGELFSEYGYVSHSFNVENETRETKD